MDATSNDTKVYYFGNAEVYFVKIPVFSYFFTIMVNKVVKKTILNPCGNGRIGRVINNYLLIREGFVPINIKFIDRKKYYDAFKEFDEKGATGIMEEILVKALTNSYHKRLAYLEGKKIVLLSDYAKSNKISHSNLINKATRQTIEAFLEKGVWKIGEESLSSLEEQK